MAKQKRNVVAEWFWMLAGTAGCIAVIVIYEMVVSAPIPAGH